MSETSDRIKRLEGMNETYRIVIDRNEARLKELEKRGEPIDKICLSFAEIVRINDFCFREIANNNRILDKIRNGAEQNA